MRTVEGDAPIRALLDRYASAWGAGDRDGWLATFADGATQEDPIGEGVRHGREGIGRFWDDAMSGYDGGIELTPRAVHVVGGEAAMEWTIVGTAGDLETEFDGVDVFTFDGAGDGMRIASVRAYWQREGRTVRPRQERTVAP